MTSAPADLLAFRTEGRAVTGLPAVEFGLAPDADHLGSGGYHVGVEDIQRIGRWNTDYSTRQARDRRDGTNTTSAADIGSAWRTGGRAAWLRFNNLLYAEMRDRPGNLPALRAINVSLDGKAKRRYDQLHRDQGLISSTDTVDGHTHLEFWRDTEGHRGPTLARIVQLMGAAVANTSPAATTGDDMPDFTDQDINAWHQAVRIDALRNMQEKNALGETMPLVTAIKGLQVAAAADADRDAAALAAVKALTDVIKAGGGNVDSVAIIAAVTAAGDESRAQYTAQSERIAELERELAATREAAEANLSPAERAALNTP